MENKNCNKCLITKELSEFNKDSSRADGYSYICRYCKKSYSKEYYLDNSDTKRNYYLENKDKISEKNKIRYDENKEFYSIKNKNYREQRLLTDPLFKLRYVIKGVIRDSFRKNSLSKTSRTFDILGCNIPELKEHLELQFEDWMTWDNRGLYNGKYNYGWDIDHIIPISSAETAEDIVRLNHYTNLQPLCSKINRYEKMGKTNY